MPGRNRPPRLRLPAPNRDDRFPHAKIKAENAQLMLPDIEKLLELQIADQEIRKLQEEIAELPRRIAAIEQKLAGTRAHLEKARAAAKADEANKKKFETAIQDLQGKISKYRDQSLDVKTNEQYKALLHEIQFSEQEIRINEDRILEVMVNVDAREKDVKAAEAKLKAETAEIEKEKEDARRVTAEDQAKLTEWNAKRDGLRHGIDPDLLRHYERVMKFRRTGLAEVLEQKCMGCQVRLRPQHYNEVFNGQQIVFCDSCQRVLYYNPANEPKPEQAVEHRPRQPPRPPQSRLPASLVLPSRLRRSRRGAARPQQSQRHRLPRHLRHALRPPDRRNP